MSRARPLVLTTSFALVLGAGSALLAGSVAFGPPLVPPAAAQQAPPDLGAEWTKQEETALANAAKEYEKLYEWCLKKSLESTGDMVRRRVLRYQPENAEVREHFGYEKQKDGTWVVNEIRREKLRQVADIEDPKASTFSKEVAKTEKRIVNQFKALAQKARKNSAEKTEAGNAAAWNEREVRNWQRVLQADSTNEEAHKALNHEKLENRYVSPFAKPFVLARKARKEAGLAVAKKTFDVKKIPAAGLVVEAGLGGAGAAQSEHVTITTTHGEERAAQLCLFAERALEDFCTIYGVDPSVKARLQVTKFDLVRDKDELEKLLIKARWEQKEIKRMLERFGGMSAVQGEYAGHNSGGAEAEDGVMHRIGHVVAHAALPLAHREVGSAGVAAGYAGTHTGPEDWMEESIAYDITRRISGTTLTTCGAFGKYGNSVEAKPNQDIWIELAKMQVENDDDAPLKRIWKLKLADGQIDGPVTVKGYAFLQYLFEADAEKARKFVKVALAQGTPAAAIALEGGSDPEQALDALDAKYREWILKSW